MNAPPKVYRTQSASTSFCDALMLARTTRSRQARGLRNFAVPDLSTWKVSAECCLRTNFNLVLSCYPIADHQA